MGCVNSKKSGCHSPDASPDVAPSASNARRRNRSGRRPPLDVETALGPLDGIKEDPEREAEVAIEEEIETKWPELGHNEDSGNVEPHKDKEVVGIQFGRLIAGEHVAAGWPAWLAAAAGEAIDGWLPLKSSSFEKLEKIGQGTYSNVYRARDLTTGKMVAVKKVRFDNFQQESVRFMAREIVILRRLDHPNVMKLEGIITSRLSCSVCLVFEYMEHDLTGLLASPSFKFTDSQIKCLMRQLLTGLEHCHSRGIMHRDIKTSNILVNDRGILKVADFGLANFTRTENSELLTSRVVTLWYRPPELLLGSRTYGEPVDLWSAGCVLVELYIGRPFIKGRNEVEQLHKIFRLCGSPPEDYWKLKRLPLVPRFKPHHPYECTLRERCKELPKCAVNLVEKLLSIEPDKRGTATSALNSEYFETYPYPCEPSSLPKFPPSKEMDAKILKEAQRKNRGAMAKADQGSRNQPRRVVAKTLQESNASYKMNPTKVDADAQVSPRTNQEDGGAGNAQRRRGSTDTCPSSKHSYVAKPDTHQASIHSAATQAAPSATSAWTKKKKQPDVFTRLQSQPVPRCQRANADAHRTCESETLEIDDSSGKITYAKPAPLRKQAQLHPLGTFDFLDAFVPQELPMESVKKTTGRHIVSGPLMYQSQEQQPHNRSHFSKVSGGKKRKTLSRKNW